MAELTLAYRGGGLQLTFPWSVLIDGYLAELAAAGRPESTIRLRRDQLTHVARELGMAPRQVTRGSLLGFFATQCWATETRRSYRSAVRGLFCWAVRAGYVADDPAADLPAIRQRAGVPRPVPEPVYVAALAAAGSRVALMLRLAGEAGLRRGEIAAVSSGDLFSTEGGPCLLVHGKGGNERLIPLPAGLARQIRGARGWLFPNGRVANLCLRQCNVYGAGQRRRAYLTYPTRPPHTRTGSHDLRAVQVILGHSSPAVTQRYVAVCDMDLRAAMDAAAK